MYRQNVHAIERKLEGGASVFVPLNLCSWASLDELTFLSARMAERTVRITLYMFKMRSHSVIAPLVRPNRFSTFGTATAGLVNGEVIIHGHQRHALARLNLTNDALRNGFNSSKESGGPGIIEPARGSLSEDRTGGRSGQE
jgi:hypothetical protein